MPMVKTNAEMLAEWYALLEEHSIAVRAHGTVEWHMGQLVISGWHLDEGDGVGWYDLFSELNNRRLVSA